MQTRGKQHSESRPKTLGIIKMQSQLMNPCNAICSPQATECAGKLMHRGKRAREIIKDSEV